MNRRPPRPERGALTKLRYSPSTSTTKLADEVGKLADDAGNRSDIVENAICELSAVA